MRKSLATAAGVSMLAVMPLNAEAGVVCNDAGDCWHTHEHYKYPAAANVTVHEDGWTWSAADADHYRWREHEGRGYWKDGAWRSFEEQGKCYSVTDNDIDAGESPPICTD